MKSNECPLNVTFKMPMEPEMDHEDEYECLLDHIILPRVLPHSRHRNLSRHESLLLRRMVDTIDNSLKWIPNATVDLFHSMKRVHFSPAKAEIINSEINALRPGGTFAMFVRKQNCAFMIHMPKEQENTKSHAPSTVIVSTFPGNLHPREIYSHPSDLEFQYPTQSLRMKYSPMMRSQAFAHQLNALNETLPVETKVRNYVSTWLMTVLSDESTKIAQFETIRKKIRDEVLGEKVVQKSGIDPKVNIVKSRFFRRSSHYAVIKVLLQLSLTIEVGEEAGKIIYKMIMLEYMTRMCEEFENNCYEKLNIDLMTQLMAKMARRIEKLSEMDFDDIDDETNAKHSHIIQIAKENFGLIINHAKNSISYLRNKIDLQILELQRMAGLESQLDQLRGLDFEADVYYRIPKLQDHLRGLKKLMNGENSYDAPLQMKISNRHRLNQSTAPDATLFADIELEIDLNLYLNDFENWILYKLKFKDNGFHCTTLREWFIEYSTIADRFYANDPLGSSRMLLVRLKLVGMIDRLATETHPMLLEHRSSIDTKCFEILLLPQKIDMKIAHELQNYFLQRNRQDNYGLIEEKDVNNENGNQLFSCRFASQNNDMQQVRLEILNESRQRVEQLQQEWEMGREIVMKLQDEKQRMSHEYHSFMDNRGNMNTRHDRNCQYCFMQKRINQVQLTQYIRPLPACNHRQNAIIFELRIPIEIAALRDVLHLMTKSSQKTSTTVDIKSDWIEDEQLLAYKFRTQKQSVNVGSTVTIPVSSYHVNYDFETFIVDNNKNCILHADRFAIVTAIGVQGLKNRCSLDTEKDSVYSTLRWALKSTTHSQNQVLARQSECPHDLSLSEFIQFGSLRADGYRLQWRKLYAMIETDALSFDQPSVMSLVLQTIWETGINGESGFLRESHDDLNNSKFVLEMVNLLNRYTDKQKKNWIHPMKLLIAAFVAVRIFEINDNKAIVDHIVSLLNKIRAIAIDWMSKIENALHEMTNRTQLHEESLRLLLVNVAITGCITFFVNSQHKYFDKIFVDNPTKKMSAARIWLQSAITLNNNILLDTHVKTKIHSDLRTFIRVVRYVGVHIEEKMQELLEADQGDVIKLVKKQWALAGKGKFGRVYIAAECPQYLVVEVFIQSKKKNLTIDLVTGSFLVNNLPVARLPENIHSSSVFKSVFGKYPFEVQPDMDNSFTTLQNYNGCTYEFGCLNNNVTIIERRDDETEMQLIPCGMFKRFVPMVLVENYSHWWDKERNVIEFRPKSFNDPNFSRESGDYRLDMNCDRLTHLKTRRSMICINSPSYQLIRDHLLRLEREKFIHVLINEEEPFVADIELVRMNLKFRVDCSLESDDGYDMVSNEFSGMRVSLKQNCGTLYGLKHGFLLESIPGPEQFEESLSSVSSLATRKVLIVPHSTVQSDCLDGHASVEMNLNVELRNPPFHRYDVDVSLKQLNASTSNFSAWFYLAYLHALTSHGQCEPFTGMSGIERALQILQSSFVWSSAPYDSEAIQTLRSIAKLSPRRSLKKDVQQIEWPKGVLKNSAQDSFIFIVDKLIEDSQRLGVLHFQAEPIELTKLSDLQLNRRDYLRCLQLMPNLRVRDIFIEHEELQTEMPDVPANDYSRDTRLISSLYHRGAYTVPKDLNLTEFLSEEDDLSGPMAINLPNILEHQLTEFSFSNLWFSLYEAARTCQLSQEESTLIWTLYAHEGKNIPAILALQAVAMNPNMFSRIDPPPFDNYITSEGTYDMAKVAMILQSFYTKPPDYHTENWSEADRNYHNMAINTEIQQLQLFVDHRWPCDEVDLSDAPVAISPRIALPEATLLLNDKLRLWNCNRQLDGFIGDIEERLRDLQSSILINQPDLAVTQSYASEHWLKYKIDFEAKMCDKLDDFDDEVKEADDYWKMTTQQSFRSAADWWEIYDDIVNSIDKKHLIDAGMYPCMVPSLVLPRIACQKTDRRLKSIIGALAMHIADEQRDRRIESYKKQSQMQPVMDRELENEPHVNWKPSDYPEWLLFEIEQNLTIRRIQIEIAKRMIDPPDNIGAKHSVMQLNMGEGKTAVIVPILAAVLANGDQACQITVLKPLFATNLSALRQYLGGMLDRRIYTFPCRRDMPIVECADQILEIYQECKQMKGVILTLPEHRLSFQLKIYESIQKGETEAAGKILKTQKWIDTNVRSILDESDAILHAKYQLIYTVGNQLPLDGGDNRWHVAQALLKRVPHHIEHLFKEFGEEKIEFDENYVENGHDFGSPEVKKRPDVFTPCRILDETVYIALKQLLIEDFVEGKLEINFPEVKASCRDILKQLLTEKEIDTETFTNVMNDFTTVKRDILMILSGLLRFEVLKLALMKRWRVNYGVKEDGPRLMAVPFKAKDVAAENTEFGHPDVAICLTQLSYYYSGLTDQQLHRVFEALKTNQNAAGVYEKWLKTIPDVLIEDSIRTFSGVNLSDPTQRDELLFPLLRFNMHVIDYWLSINVYPREAKTFEKKLMCTAWDLCNDHMEHRVTGFSGTNDTKNILPLPIAQNDLEELEQTNEKVRMILLQPENEAYEKLPANVSGRMILEKLDENNIPVLLDAGALMLELNNEETAREWLALVSPKHYDAAVYFDSHDILQTIDRNGVVAAFDCSVYRDNLERCLVYLDDAHTRGTDLKFPLKRIACVTLSGDIARDKTVQACMRMRQLGEGHSIAFWASHEADIRIREVCLLSCDSRVQNEHVIKFICSNSKRFETENTVHFAAAAYNYTKKMAGHKLYHISTEETKLMNLYSKCVDDEFVALENMYGDKEEALLTEITASKFDKLAELYRSKEKLANYIRYVKKSVVQKLEQQASHVKRFKQALDEHQEKELEHELEEERHVERPPKMLPAVPKFDIQLQKLFLNGAHDIYDKLKSGRVLLPLSSSLLHTKLFKSYAREPCPWSKNLYATRDFGNVLENDSLVCDDFLRPVWWIACLPDVDKTTTIWVLLSSFECDRLITTFRRSKKSALFMYRPRLSKFHNNLLHMTGLHVTAIPNPMEIDLKLEVEIGVFAGSMYFKNETEQQKFCSFLGLIPRPRSSLLEIAFDTGIIKPNGFVQKEKRNNSKFIAELVGECRFVKNPADLVIKLIIAHHHFMREESHVASIVDRGDKQLRNGDVNGFTHDEKK